MKPAFHEIQISSVTVGTRLRAIDPAWVEALAKSIAAIGLQHPITVVRETDGSHTLLAGAHRLAAAQSLGWGEIPAQVIEANWIKDHERRLHEILENLMRNELTKLDRAASLSELKNAHEALYPQTKHGQHGGRGGKKNESAIFGFSKTTAEQTGLSKSAIELAVAIWKGLSPETRTRLQGTWLADHQAGLKTLSEETPDRQAAICDVLFCEPPKAGNLVEAIRIVDGRRKSTEADKMYRSAIGAMDRMTPRKRRDVYENFEDEIRAFAKDKGWI